MKARPFFAAAILFAVASFPVPAQEDEVADAPIFAEDARESEQEPARVPAKPAPKNTFALDIRPDLLILGFITDMVMEEPVILFGVAPWYGRKITENLSVGGRLGYGMFYNEAYIMQSSSADASVRYDFGEAFFEGTLGYANVFINDFDKEQRKEGLAHFIRYGGKVGNRFDFGRKEGFMVEAAVGLGFGHQVAGSLDFWSNTEAYGFGFLANFMQNALAWGLFVGGASIHIGFGYVF